MISISIVVVVDDGD